MKQNETIVVPPKLVVFSDKKTGFKTVAFPFDYQDGTHGVVMITRLLNELWEPADNVESIILNFKK